MSSGQAYAERGLEDYKRLCAKFNVRVYKWSMHHHYELQRREAREDGERIAEANADNVRRYLQEATNAQLRGELKRRGLK